MAHLPKPLVLLFVVLAEAGFLVHLPVAGRADVPPCPLVWDLLVASLALHQLLLGEDQLINRVINGRLALAAQRNLILAQPVDVPGNYRARRNEVVEHYPWQDAHGWQG